MRLLPRASSFETLTDTYGSRYRWMLLTVVGIGIVAGVLETSAFNVAIPALGHEFQLGQGAAQWAMTGFMAAMTLSMLPASWLLERIGFRRLFLSAVLLLALSSVAGSLATSFGAVVAARVLQGAATGVLQPLGLLLVMRLFPVGSQGSASGVLTFGIAATPAIAPAFGGMLVDRFGWPAIFLLSMPFAIVALVAGLYLLPARREMEVHRFDLFGCLLLALATVLLMVGVAGLRDEGLFALRSLGALAGAALLVAGFVVHARRCAAPVIHLELFRKRTFAMGSIVSFTYGFGLFGSTYLVPVYLQDALAYSATAAGSVLLPGGIALVLTTPIAGRLVDRYAPRSVTIAGLLLFGVSFLVLAALGGGIGATALLLVIVLGRIGLGLVLPALNLACLRGLPPERMSQSSVVVSYMRQLGGVLGIAGTAIFVAWRHDALAGQPGSLAKAYVQGFLLLSALVLAAMLAAVAMKERKEPAR